MRWIRNMSLSMAAIVLCLLMFEAVLRFLPVSDISRAQLLTADAVPFDVAAAPGGTIAFSRLAGFRNARYRQVNAQGFLSDFDYEPGAEGPIAIGDSYTEALQVAFDETWHQRMSDAPVYNFAISGAPLSQYEAYLQQACDLYRPTHAVITIIANDFDESLHDWRAADGFFHYRADGTLTVSPRDVGGAKAVLTRSSLVRYLYFNLNMARFLSQPSAPGLAVDPARLTAQQEAIDRFLTGVGGHCLRADQMTFVVDANRSGEADIYSESPARRAGPEYFLEQARLAGFGVIDLQPIMRAAHEETGARMEFPFDQHWNAAAHELVGRAIRERLELR